MKQLRATRRETNRGKTRIQLYKVMTRRSSAILVRLGLVTSAMAASFLSVAFYSKDLACGIFAAFVFLSAMCEFGLAAASRS
jgi:hypothetical protein